jgi:hypothetical protein
LDILRYKPPKVLTAFYLEYSDKWFF